MDPEKPSEGTEPTFIGKSTPSSELLERSGPVGRGEMVGPYLVLDVIGEGGMGIVYSAYHPGLNRKAAVKVVRPDIFPGEASKGGHTRLLREAQAMAQLAHPNVVGVFDAGAIGDKVFIAMELVEGKTLRRWIEGEPHDWRDVVAMFVEAGRGLAAAHRVGLVHRDFKPDNVLVGADGHARVTDFGLARTAENTTTESIETTPSGKVPILHSAMTEFGIVMGTPGFLSPEQAHGRHVDARGDQFSFFASLHEGLYGTLPFEGTSLVETLPKMDKGLVRPAPHRTHVPSRVRRVLLRGLSPRPEDRYPTLDEGLDALQRASRRWHRRWWPALATAAAVAVTALAVVGVRHRRLRCSGFEGQIAQLWGPESKARLRAGFDGTKVSYAGDAWVPLERTLDAYARSWVQARTQACQSEEWSAPGSAAANEACLDDRLEELGATLSGLGERIRQGDKEMVRTAVQAATALTPVSRCSDARALKSAPPQDAARAEEASQLRRRLARVLALVDLYQHKEAEAAAQALVADARKAGDRPVLAEALYLLGESQRRRTLWKPALESLEEADLVADAIGFDWLRARIAPTIASNYNLSQDNAGGLVWIRRAHALIERIGGEPGAEIRTDTVEAAIAWAQGRPDDMLASMGRALEIARANFGEQHLQTIKALTSLAIANYNVGRFEECLRVSEQNIAISEQMYGPDYPDVAEARKLAGGALVHLDRAEEGKRMLERALVPLAAAWGPEDFRVGEIEGELARAYRDLGDMKEALAHLRRSEGIFAKAFGPQSDLVLEALCTEIEDFRLLGDLGAASEVVARANALPGHRKDVAAERLHQAGYVQLEQGKVRDAKTSFEHGLEALGSAGSGAPEVLAGLQTGLGEAYLASKRPADAIAPLEKATVLLASKKDWGVEAARTQFGLARALWETNGDRARAVTLATDARGRLAQAPSWARPLGARVDAWLAAHPHP